MVGELAEYLAEIVGGGHHDPFVGLVDHFWFTDESADDAVVVVGVVSAECAGELGAIVFLEASVVGDRDVPVGVVDGGLLHAVLVAHPGDFPC